MTARHRLGLLFLCALAVPTVISAATITVRSTANAGGTCPGADCTLRQAITTSAAGDTIDFLLPGNSTIALTTGELAINKNLTIKGPGANVLTVQRSTASGTPAFRVFNVTAAGVTATISGMKLANGTTSGSGGAIISLGTLNVSGVTITGNSARNGGGVFNNGGTMKISHSTVSGNSVSHSTLSGSGGGIFTNGGTVYLTSSTVSGNTAVGPGGNSDSGGGIFSNFGTVNLNSSTVTNNTGDLGGGIRNIGGTLNSTSTIIALNTSPAGPNVNGSLASEGANLIGDNSGATITPAGNDQIGTAAAPIDPMLGQLQDNGGPTQTHALLPGSPAIDKGYGAVGDQRGFPQPVDDPTISNAGNGSDIGSFEVHADDLPGCNQISHVVTNNNDSGPGSLRGVMADVCSGSTITFAPNVRGTITLTSGVLTFSNDYQLGYDKHLNIAGPGADLLTVQRSTSGITPDFPIFNVEGGTSAISGLTIANGSVTDVSGGGIANSGNLTISGCVISGNRARGTSPRGRGGGIANFGYLTIIDSIISDNSTNTQGGGISNSSGVLTIINTAVRQNGAFTRGSEAGGIYSGGTGTVAILNSTISSNNDSGLVIKGGTATIAASTFSDNQNGGFGGAIEVESGSVAISNSTIVGNSGTDGGGVSNNGTLTLRNTIIALNTATSSAPDVGGPVTSEGFNLIGNGSGAVITPTTGDQIGTAGAPIDPLLGPLQDNGGATHTHALLAGSPAIDQGHSGGAVLDQREFSRRVDQASVVDVADGDRADIGAFELGGLPLRVISIRRSGVDIAVTFEAAQGATYRLERKLSLLDSAWQSPLGDAADFTAPENGEGQITHTGGATEPRAFYRVRLLPP